MLAAAERAYAFLLSLPSPRAQQRFVSRSRVEILLIYFVWVFIFIKVSWTYNFILFSGVQHSDWNCYSLQCDCHNESSRHLSPYEVITIILTFPPMLYIITMACFAT